MAQNSDGSSSKRTEATEAALAGIRVLDLSEGIAGPYCAKLLADFGADVIKVEAPGGDWARARGPFPGDVPHPETSGLFLWLNTNKSGVTLDVFSPTGRVLLDRLIEQADILVQSFPPKDIEGLGLTYEALASLNPSLVVTSITPWGLTGPMKDYVASEIVLDAWGHAMSSFGPSDREPLTVGGSFRQYFSGQVAALATLAARLSAEATGVGQMLDISMIEAQLGSQDRRAFHLLRYQYQGEVVEREPPNAHAATIMMGYHPCKDGWVSGGIRAGSFAQLARLIGRAEWLEDPRFMPIEEKFKDPALLDEIEAELLMWMSERTRKQIISEAQKVNLQFFPVNRFSDVLQERHFHERGYWVAADHDVAGRLTYPGAPFRMASGGFRLRRPAPKLGEHNREVFCGLLGLAESDLAALASQGVTTRTSGISEGKPTIPKQRVELTRSSGRVPPPLEGVRVVDLTVIWAGPYATMLLSDLGAEVIRVESLQYFPSATRGHSHVRPTRADVEHMGLFPSAYVDKEPGERPWNRWAVFNVTSRNKLSMTADISRPEGLEVFKQLIAKSDVVVDNYSAGTLDRMGIGFEELRSVNPDIIQLSMPLFGNSGTYRDFRGVGNAVDAFSGFLAMRGHLGSDVSASQPTFYMDATSGPAAAIAILMALRHRQRGHGGQFIDMSQVENLLHQAGEYFLDVQMNGRDPEPLGNRDRWGALQGCYRCAGQDSWLVITVRDDRDWLNLCAVLGNPPWCRAAEFETTLSRLANHDEFDARISEWTNQIPAVEAERLLQEAGIAAARVMNEQDIFADPHVASRGFFVEMTHPDCGTHLYPGHLWKTSANNLVMRRAAPTLGQDNEYVYKKLLGLSDVDYAALVEEGHIGTEYVQGLSVGPARRRSRQ